MKNDNEKERSNVDNHTTLHKKSFAINITWVTNIA